MSIDITFRDIDRNDAVVLMDIYELLQAASRGTAFTGDPDKSIAEVLEIARIEASKWAQEDGIEWTLQMARRLVIELERIEKTYE